MKERHTTSFTSCSFFSFVLSCFFEERIRAKRKHKEKEKKGTKEKWRERSEMKRTTRSTCLLFFHLFLFFSFLFVFHLLNKDKGKERAVIRPSFTYLFILWSFYSIKENKEPDSGKVKCNGMKERSEWVKWRETSGVRWMRALFIFHSLRSLHSPVRFLFFFHSRAPFSRL